MCVLDSIGMLIICIVSGAHSKKVLGLNPAIWPSGAFLYFFCRLYRFSPTLTETHVRYFRVSPAVAVQSRGKRSEHGAAPCELCCPLISSGSEGIDKEM